MDSMADMMKKLGWIAWCLTVINWFASPIINQLVNKLFVYIEFDASAKLKELKRDTIPGLKQMLDDVEEQMVLRAAKDKGSRGNLKILDSMQRDLKSALYEAEDILDLLDYRRIEKDLHLEHDDSYWVENQLGTACTWIARCKRSSFGRWIDVTLAAVMKCAQSVTRQGQILIEGWRHWKPNFDLFCSHRAVNIAGSAVLQCAQSWYQNLHWRLPVSCPEHQPPGFESTGSEFVPADRTHRPAEEMVDEEEIVEETQVEGETQDGEAEKVEPTSLSILRYFVRPMLTWVVKSCSYRDWLHGIVGTKNDKDDDSAAELVSITERISLMIRIKRIEDILTASKKSDLLNDKNNRSNKDTDKERIKNSGKASSSKQKEIDDIEKKVFGREEDCENISRMLRGGPDADAPSSSTSNAPSSSTSKPYSVICMYGITGSGKSTLAKYVCDYEKGIGHFNPIMFIRMRKTFSVADMFRDMLEKITQSWPSSDKDLKSLKTQLQQELKGKRFLLVLDDLWVSDENEKEWDILVDTLSAGLRGSRVLVTSQKTDAAGALLVAQQQISIPYLEEGVYLSLFMHHA